MRLPSKTTPYDRSVFRYFSRIAATLRSADEAPMDLFDQIEVDDKTIGDYLDALDCLFALGKIDLTEGGKLHYVG